MKNRHTAWEGVEVQMAPMIDMVFLLLVFFMTVSTMATDARPEMALADSQEGRVSRETPLRFYLSLKLDDGGELQCFFGSEPITLENAGETVRKHRQDFPESEWVIRIPKGLVWEDYRQVLSSLGKQGLSKIIFAVYEN